MDFRESLIKFLEYRKDLGEDYFYLPGGYDEGFSFPIENSDNCSHDKATTVSEDMIQDGVSGYSAAVSKKEFQLGAISGDNEDGVGDVDEDKNDEDIENEEGVGVMDEEAIKQNDEDENEEVDEDDNEEVDEDDNEDVDEDDNEDVDEDDNKDDDDDASSELGAYCDEIKNCTNCPLHKTRNRFVFGMGNPNAELVFIGEAPGRDEDKQGLPFVGRAGKLFDKILAAMELTRDDVYICNILKCRPPGNRDPLPNEVTQCIPYLERQIEIIKPKLICALGRVAAQNLLDTKDPLSKLRGDIHFFRDTPVVTTYHPAALLRNPHFKGPAWRDFKWIVKILKDEELLRKYKPQKAQKLELDF